MDNITLTLKDFNLEAGLDTQEYLSGIDVQKQQVIHIICTSKRSRLGRPKFGCYVIKFLFDPMDGETTRKIQTEIYRALQDPDNDISGFTVTRVEVVPDYENQQYFVEISFINDVNTKDSLSINLTRQ